MAKRLRKHAEDQALEILEQNRAVTDADLLDVLARWRFKTNKTRLNVLPEGEESVFSDTLGLVIDRATRKTGLDAASKKCPSMLRLLAVWVRDRQPSMFKMPFPFTSISVNYATVYQCKNCAPSSRHIHMPASLLCPSTGTLHGCTGTEIMRGLR